MPSLPCPHRKAHAALSERVDQVNKLIARMNVQLAVNMANVSLRRVIRDEKLLFDRADLLVLRQKPQDLLFALRKPKALSRLRAAVDQFVALRFSARVLDTAHAGKGQTPAATPHGR